MVHDIVILGANYAGIRIAHTLLGSVIPGFPQKNQSDFKVTLASPSTKFFHTVASPRAVSQPDLIAGNELQREFLPYFEQYKKPGDDENSGLHFVKGYAVSLDPESKTIQLATSTDGDKQQEIKYDSLIIATGASTSTRAFKPLDNGDENELKQHLIGLADKIKSAQTIAIGGGGSTAVELASEIKEVFPDKKVTIYCGSSGIMPNIPKPQSTVITERLTKNFNVEIVTSIVESSSEDADAQYNLSLSSSEKGAYTAKVDLYIPTIGQTPNTKFLPASMVDPESKKVLCDQHLRVKGYPRVYTIGDVCERSLGNLDSLRNQTGALKETLTLELATLISGDATADAALTPYGEDTGFKYKSADPVRPETSFVVTLGSKGGVGMLSGYRVPNFLVRVLKAKDLGMPMGQILINGGSFAMKFMTGHVKV